MGTIVKLLSEGCVESSGSYDLHPDELTYVSVLENSAKGIIGGYMGLVRAIGMSNNQVNLYSGALRCVDDELFRTLHGTIWSSNKISPKLANQLMHALKGPAT